MGARRPAPSACWGRSNNNKKKNKKKEEDGGEKGVGGLLWVKGMKVWLTGEIIQAVSQSVSGTNNLQLRLTQTDNAKTHQFTLAAAITVYQRGGAEQPSALSVKFTIQSLN